MKLAGFMLLVMSATAHADVDNTRQQELMYLLLQDCGSCHGMTLNGGLGPALLPENLRDKPDEMLIITILEGRPGTPMPPWKSLLTHDDAAWLVMRLRSGVKEKENANCAALAHPAPAAFAHPCASRK